MSDTISTTRLILNPAQKQAIEAEGVSAYPHECCGIIYGHDQVVDGITHRVVDWLEPVANDFDPAEKYHRFSIAPATLLAAERKAGDAGKLVLGFYHSHPDHPARPSEYDRTHAWPFYSYAIVAIHQGKPVDLTSWQLNPDTEQFDSEPIVEIQDV